MLTTGRIWQCDVCGYRWMYVKGRKDATEWLTDVGECNDDPGFSLNGVWMEPPEGRER